MHFIDDSDTIDMAWTTYYCPDCGKKCTNLTKNRKAEGNTIECPDCGRYTIECDNGRFFIAGDKRIPYLPNVQSVDVTKHYRLDKDDLKNLKDYKEALKCAHSAYDLCIEHLEYFALAMEIRDRICDLCRDGVAKGFDLRNELMENLAPLSFFGDKRVLMEGIETAKDIGTITRDVHILMDSVFLFKYYDELEGLCKVLSENYSPKRDDDIPPIIEYYLRMMYDASLSEDRYIAIAEKAVEESRHYMERDVNWKLVESIEVICINYLDVCDDDLKRERVFADLRSFTERNAMVNPVSYCEVLNYGYRNDLCAREDLDRVEEIYKKTNDRDCMTLYLESIFLKAYDDESQIEKGFDFVTEHGEEVPYSVYMAVILEYCEYVADDPVRYKAAMKKIRKNGVTKKDIDEWKKQNEIWYDHGDP